MKKVTTRLTLESLGDRIVPSFTSFRPDNPGVVNSIFIDDGSFDNRIDISNPALGGSLRTTMYVSEGDGPPNSQPRSVFRAGWNAFWDDIGDGLGRVANGAGNSAVELGQVGRDVGNSGLSLGSHIPDYFFDTGVYDYDFHSRLIGGYSKAAYSNPPSSPGNYQSPQAAEIQFRTMRGVATLGLYDLGSDYLEARETGDYSKFQESSGAFAFGVALPYAPGAVKGVGRAAGPYLNPGNYRLNPNSLQSFPSVPLEYNGPTFTRPTGAGPVPVGPQGPTVVQSPPLTGPVTVTGPAAAGSPALTPAVGAAGGAQGTPATSTSASPPLPPRGPAPVSESNPRAYLNEAVSQQGYSSAPAGGFKQTWSEGGYTYEVRVHPADPAYGMTGSIYRVARRNQTLDANGQGGGWEYMDAKGVWHPQRNLKPNSPTLNKDAARDTHIPLPAGGTTP